MIVKLTIYETKTDNYCESIEPPYDQAIKRMQREQKTILQGAEKLMIQVEC